MDIIKHLHSHTPEEVTAVDRTKYNKTFINQAI